MELASGRLGAEVEGAYAPSLLASWWRHAGCWASPPPSRVELPTCTRLLLFITSCVAGACEGQRAELESGEVVLNVDDSKPLVEGWLAKQTILHSTTNRTPWRNRYFILKRGCIHYYDVIAEVMRPLSRAPSTVATVHVRARTGRHGPLLHSLIDG